MSGKLDLELGRADEDTDGQMDGDKSVNKQAQVIFPALDFVFFCI